MNGIVDSVNRFCIQLDTLYFVDGGICFIVTATAVFFYFFYCHMFELKTIVVLNFSDILMICVY
jgi:hypothetical protein